MLSVWTNTSSKPSRDDEDAYIKANSGAVRRLITPDQLAKMPAQDFDLLKALDKRPEIIVDVDLSIVQQLDRLTKVSRETRDQSMAYVEARFKDNQCILTAKNDRKMMSISSPTKHAELSAEAHIMLSVSDVEQMVGFLTKTFDSTRIQIMGDVFGESIAYIYVVVHGTEVSNGVLSDTGPKEMDSKPKACVLRLARGTDEERFDFVEIPPYEEHYTAVIKKTSKWALRSKPEYVALESRAGILNIKFLGEDAQPIVANLGSPIMLNGKQISGDTVLNSLNGRFVAEFLNEAKDDITIHFGNRDEHPVILEDGSARLSLLPAYSQQLTGQETFLKKVKGKVVTDSTPDLPKVSERRSHSVATDTNPTNTPDRLPIVNTSTNPDTTNTPDGTSTINTGAGTVSGGDNGATSSSPSVEPGTQVAPTVPAAVLRTTEQSSDGRNPVPVSDLVVAVRSLQSALESIANHTDELLDRIARASKELRPKRTRNRGGEVQREFLRAIIPFKGSTIKTALLREHCSLPSSTQIALISHLATMGIIEKKGRGVMHIPMDFEEKIAAAGWVVQPEQGQPEQEQPAQDQVQTNIN